MDLGLSGRKVVVTGGSKGIGRATARSFAAEGARVIIVSRDEARLAEAARAVAAETGGEVDFMAADLSRDADREAVFDRHGDADVLVNNAGAIKAGGLNDLSMAQWRDGWELKVFGYIHLCKLFAPAMFERGAGTIVNIIGMGGRAFRANYICGAAGNAALIGFTSALGAEAARHGCRAFGINPSVTLTDRMSDMLKTRAANELGDAGRWEELLDPTRFPYGRPAHADEIAALATMLASERVHYLSGTVVDMDGGGRWTS
ncbi:short-chain dehydrogenase [Zhengella mangrovi]|uniref:Short-chain dehydrogenase n=1 Tax=Zhengella mangrovi TaxID=1982044 RepID=A0A2G1QPD6_9HYPH|nr:short-chain dehydrogenase/reductase [Zhengella mangrovi]PHP67339.1 short-chain dehydrogenase [Zhengella mangrovi]